MDKQEQFVNMGQLATSAKAFVGVLGGIVSGWEPMLQALVFFTVIDYVSGCIKALIRKEWTSEQGGKGIAKKSMMFLLVACCHYADLRVLPAVLDMGPLKLGPIVAGLYAANEFGSIIENVIAAGVPVPGVVRKALAGIKEKFSA